MYVLKKIAPTGKRTYVNKKENNSCINNTLYS